MAELKKIGHRVAGLAELATTSGLLLEQAHSEVLAHLDNAEVAIESRYIVTGFTTRPAHDALAAVAEHLDQTVCAALAERGYSVQKLNFVAPKPEKPDNLSNVLEEPVSRVLLHLFNADKVEHRGVRLMARMFGLERGMLDYYLDRLKDCGLAALGSIGPHDSYWAVTPAGRKFVVESIISRRDAT